MGKMKIVVPKMTLSSMGWLAEVIFFQLSGDNCQLWVY